MNNRGHTRANSLVRIPTVEELKGNTLRVQYGRKIKRLFGLNISLEFKVEKLPYSVRLNIASFLDSFLMIISIVPEIDFCQSTNIILSRSIAYDKLLGLDQYYPKMVKERFELISHKMFQANALPTFSIPIRICYPSFFVLTAGRLKGVRFERDSNPLWLLEYAIYDPDLREAIDKALSKLPFKSLILEQFRFRFAPEFGSTVYSKKRPIETSTTDLIIPASKRGVGFSIMNSILNTFNQ